MLFKDDENPTTGQRLDEGDVWRIVCMDCGARLGTVNAGNVDGARQLRRKHDQALHG